MEAPRPLIKLVKQEELLIQKQLPPTQVLKQLPPTQVLKRDFQQLLDDEEEGVRTDCHSPTGRTGTVTFKPYDDIRGMPPKKRFHFGEEQKSSGSVSVEDLYPEILCLIFSKLDDSSKGRAAQVN